MHLRLSQVLERALVAASLLAVTPGLVTARADDDGFLSRLFRGGSSASSANSSASRPAAAVSGGGATSSSAASGQPGSQFTPTTGSNYGGLTTQVPVTTPPSLGASAPAQRLSPRPRTSTAVTSADPLLTRLALGRSDDGSQFGMFLQIFADGTVIDSEGVHHLRQADLKPILELIQSGDLTRTRGHCGAPATDFIDYVNIVVYERRLGRLWAHSLSYSGNTQGCDHAVRHLHTTLESLQMKLSHNSAGAQTPAGTQGNPRPLAPIGGAGSPPAFERQPAPPAVNPGQPAPGGVIPLTPVDSSR